MLVLILGVLDLICAIGFLLLHFNVGLGIMFFIGIISYLGLKAIIFRGDFASIIDGACAIFMITMLIGLRTHFVWLAIFYLAQKGFFSLKDMLS